MARKRAETCGRMRIRAALAAACLHAALGLFLAVPVQAQHPGQTSLKIDPPQLDLGNVNDDRPATGRVWLQNASDRPIRVSIAGTSCGCTAGTLSKESLGPGSGQWLNITLNSAGKSGELKQYVSLRVGERNQDVHVRVRALVRPIVDVQPRELAFFGKGQPQEATVRVTGERPGLRILAAKCSGVPATVSIIAPAAALDPAGPPAELLVRLDEGSLTPCAGTLEMTTDDPRRPFVKIPVRIGNRARGQRADGSLLLVMSPSDVAATGSLALPGSFVPPIAKVSDEGRPGVSVEWKLDEEDGSRTIRLALPWDLRSNRLYGTLLVTSEGQAEPMRVPYKVRMRPAGPRPVAMPNNPGGSK